MELSEALSTFQARTGQSQTELAELAGVDQSTISRAMNGHYGKDGWRAAMTILGLDQVIRSIDGGYSTPELPELLEMLREQIAQEREAAGPDRVAEIRELEELVAGLQRSLD